MKAKVKKRSRSRYVKEEKKVLGVTANMKNLFIAVALLFAFLGGFFKVYSWIDCTYAREKALQRVEILNDFRWESDVLNSMYSRFQFLDNIISLAIDPTKVDPDRRTEFNDLKNKIKMQEDKVKELQKKVTK